MTKAEMRRNVRRGAKLLDQEARGWAREVKLRKLDQGDGCQCVLGQVYGTFGEGRDDLGITSAESERHGFLVRIAPDRDFPVLYGVLDDLWAEEIRARRKPKVAA